MSTYSYPRPSSAPALSHSVVLVLTSITSLQVGAVLAVVAFATSPRSQSRAFACCWRRSSCFVVTRPTDMRARLRTPRSPPGSAPWRRPRRHARLHLRGHRPRADRPGYDARGVRSARVRRAAVVASRMNSPRLAWPRPGSPGGAAVGHRASHGHRPRHLAGACWAAYIALNKRCSAQFEDTLGLSLGFVVGGLMLVPAAWSDSRRSR